jgi:hypothetical protein
LTRRQEDKFSKVFNIFDFFETIFFEFLNFSSLFLRPFERDRAVTVDQGQAFLATQRKASSGAQDLKKIACEKMFSVKQV